MNRITLYNKIVDGWIVAEATRRRFPEARRLCYFEESGKSFLGNDFVEVQKSTANHCPGSDFGFG
ncbi:MAG: hypothetical protein VXB01_17900 [Opitutae bacterium]